MIRRFTDNTMIASGYVSSNNGIKTTQNGKQYATFSLAADRRDNETVWVNVKAWRNLALIADGLGKCDYVIVTGRYEEREYDGKTYKTLVADCIVGGPGAMTISDAAEPGEDQGAGPMAGWDDELPF